MKTRLLIFAVLLNAGVMSALSQSKLNLAGRKLLNQYEMIKTAENQVYSVGRQGGATPNVSVVVILNDGYDAEDLLDVPGVEISTVIDDMVIVSVGLDNLDLLAQLDAVKSVSVGRKRDLTMTFARPNAGVSSVLSGSTLPKAFTGKGVVIGMYDGGFDPNHVNFSESGRPSNTRVKAMYVYGNSGNTTPTVVAETRDEIKKITTDNTKETHGTHVAGIAAGNYQGVGDFGLNGSVHKSSNMPFYGVATDADLVLAAGELTDAHVLAGVTRCVEYAESVNKPIVINLSLGSVIGPHDGTSVLSQGLAKLGTRAIICVASGNDAQYNKAMTLEGGESDEELVNSAVGLTYGTSTVTKPYTINFWSKDKSVFKLEFVIYNTATKQVDYALNIPNTKGRGLALGGADMGSAYLKDDVFSSAFTSTSYIECYSEVESNNRYCVEIEFLLNSKSSISTLKPGFRITRTPGQVVYGYIDNPSGQSAGQFKIESGADWEDMQWGAAVIGGNGTINDVATGDNILAVGAHTSADEFTVTTGSKYSYRDASSVNDLCTFSSFGCNTATGEMLPHVTAPGSAIVSSLNEYKTSYSTNAVSGTTRMNERDNRWGSMQGTSMSSPLVSGIMGLWLEADPDLTIDDVKDIVRKTSIPYSGTDADKRRQSGAGRIDALTGLKEVLARKAAASTGVTIEDDKHWLVTPSVSGYNVYAPESAGITVKLYDMQGRCVIRLSDSGNDVEVSTRGLQSGVYVLEASDSSSNYRIKVMVR